VVRVSIKNPVSAIPYNGFSYYKIDYSGKIPEDLLKAYRQMLDLNQKPPRKNYLKERKMDPTIPRRVVTR
jgi:hypothetical protein